MENNKRFLTIIVILSVLLVGSLGYITYDKLSNKKDNTNEVKNDTKKDNNDNKENKTKDDTTKGDNKDSQIKNDKDNQPKDSSGTQVIPTKYTYKNVYGVYTNKTEIEEDGNTLMASYKLILNEDGTFIYRMGTIAGWGYIGNYTIDNNTITLNCIFKMGSDASKKVISKTKTITINSDNTLTDPKSDEPSADSAKVLLTKNSKEKNEDIRETLKLTFELLENNNR